MEEETTSRPVDLPSFASSFVTAFNRNDLDAIMQHFAADAVYFPGDGSEARGIAAIREMFEPQFSGVWGTMRYDEYDRILDTSARKLVLRWTCRMDFTQARFKNLKFWIMRLAATIYAGSRRVSWEGADIFHFDAAGKIKGKFTYSNYPFPRFKKDIGTRMPALPAS